MANDFIRIATPNISNSSNTTIYAVPNSSGSAARINRYWNYLC